MWCAAALQHALRSNANGSPVIKCFVSSAVRTLKESRHQFEQFCADGARFNSRSRKTRKKGPQIACGAGAKLAGLLSLGEVISFWTKHGLALLQQDIKKPVSAGHMYRLWPSRDWVKEGDLPFTDQLCFAAWPYVRGFGTRRLGGALQDDQARNKATPPTMFGYLILRMHCLCLDV